MYICEAIGMDDDLYEKTKKNIKNVTPKELIELLVSCGFVYKRTKGDHEMYKKPGFRTFPVPVTQKPLNKNIVKNALRLVDEIRDLEE